ncbi:MAG: HAD family hydrolase, partial [Kiritimatiellia bacterium]
MPKQLLVTPIDIMTIDGGERPSLFQAAWKAVRSRNPHIRLCYNTGRLLEDVQHMIKDGQLLRPDYIISGLGARIFDSTGKLLLRNFNKRGVPEWDLARVEEIVSSFEQIEKRPATYQGPFKSSWYYYNASPAQLEQLKHLLEAAGQAVNLIYHYARDLDILPRRANKGAALSWLLKNEQIAAKDTFAAAYTSNDIPVLQIDGIHGIVLENAQPELLEASLQLPVYQAKRNNEEGLVEGLVHFGLLEETALNRILKKAHTPRRRSRARTATADIQLHSLSAEQVALIRTAYDQAIAAIRKNITPAGFSACSLHDNETVGTDQNYRSIWSRDGSITLIGTLGLDDHEIRDCQRHTLQTLFQHMSPHGQFPSYVHIETGAADYSGIGGISSIDSGLWVVIAAGEYALVSGDTRFLQRNKGKLEKSMEWLNSQDSNVDGLLEIPEGGDWTDLFGRSYNILYDEVLWYRANIVFARTLELLRDFEQAARILHKAEVIKQAILRQFWPTTQKTEGLSLSFADMQYTLGDAWYLIAAVSPFSFDWRCDVFGNVLALLFNVTDMPRAQRSLRFMQASG